MVVDVLISSDCQCEYIEFEKCYSHILLILFVCARRWLWIPR